MVGKVISYTLSLLVLLVSVAFGVRIKDIASVEGYRYNYLVGYGLVVGLKGTGDGRSAFNTVLSIANLLKRFGISVEPRALTVKNVAAVIVTAKVPSYLEPGMTFDVEVSSIGDAKSLEGGTLVLTPLMGPDGEVYALAQGQVIVGGYEARGAEGRQVKNVPTVGRVPNGGILERPFPFELGEEREINILLDYPDFVTAKRIQDAINKAFGQELAKAVSPSVVKVKVPKGMNFVDFIASVENLEVSPDTVAKVVIDSRSGVVLFGGNVSIDPVAVTVGSLVIEIKERPEVVQPPPLSPGQTKVVPRTEVKVEEEKRRIVQLQGATVGELVNALNKLGATPREIIQVLQAIKAAGALRAKLEVL